MAMDINLDAASPQPIFNVIHKGEEDYNINHPKWILRQALRQHIPTMTTTSPDFRAIHAPEPFPRNASDSLSRAVFLAGSIDDGRAINWQATLTQALQHLPIRVLNPRRPDWDSSWRQEADSQPFREQVMWELDMQERADVIAMYLSPGSLAPISLLELGLFARSGKVLVACPPGFYRRGNVQIVCERLGIEVLDGLDELARAVESRLEVLAERTV